MNDIREERHRLMTLGHEARDIRHLISARLIAQQDKTLKHLISQYRGGKLTTEVLWAGFGEIAGLNQFLTELNRQVTQGERAQASEVENG